MNKIVKMVLVSVIAIIIMIALITGSNILFFWSIFNATLNLIKTITGLDPALAKGIASIFVAIVVMLPLGKMALSFTPIPQKNKSLYRSIIFICIGIFFMFTYFGSRNMFFDPQTGNPMKYYSIGPSGAVKLFATPGFDTETGDSLLPVTKEIILRLKGINPPQVKEVSNEPKTVSQVISNQTYSAPAVVNTIPPVDTAGKGTSIVKEENGSRIDTTTIVSGEAETKSEPVRAAESKVINNDNTASKSVLPKYRKLTAVELASKMVEYQDGDEKKSRPITIDEILSGKVEFHDSKEKASENHGFSSSGTDLKFEQLCGYSISILDNPNLDQLGNIFEIRGGLVIKTDGVFSCETTFNNISNSEFVVYNRGKEKLFRIPAKKRVVVLLEVPDYYYLSTSGIFKCISLTLPQRSKFTFTISNEENVPLGSFNSSSNGY